MSGCLLRCCHYCVGFFQRRYRFAEIRYYRAEEVRKGRTVPARVETVVLFLPDVWSCSPTRLDWQATVSRFQSELQMKLSSTTADAADAAELKALNVLLLLWCTKLQCCCCCCSSRAMVHSCGDTSVFCAYFFLMCRFFFVIAHIVWMNCRYVQH